MLLFNFVGKRLTASLRYAPGSCPVSKYSSEGYPQTQWFSRSGSLHGSSPMQARLLKPNTQSQGRGTP